MEYRNRAPVTKPRRAARRGEQRRQKNRAQDQARQRRVPEGSPNELGIVEGQNGELGNTVQPRNARSIGRSAH